MTEIDLTDGNTKGRHVQPQGFVPSHLAAPALRDQYATQLEYVAYGLGEIGALAQTTAEDEGAGIADRAAAMMIRDEAAGLRRLIKAIATGALVALVAVGLSVGGARPAAAAEAPQPDPVTVSVTLTAGSVNVGVPVTARSTDSHGKHCASVWGPTSYGRGFVGRICSRHSTFTVPVTLDSRYVPVGRSTMAVTDDVDPLGTFPQVVNLIARRPSRFGQGTWATTQYGDGLTVYATLYAYTPALGRYTPQQSSPVKVQELRAGRWVTVATGRTNRHGTFLITVILGGGRHTVRVRRDEGATVAAANGTARAFYLYPTDVPGGVV